MQNSTLLLLLIAGLLTTSCSNVIEIAPELEPYLEQVKMEGELRGIELITDYDVVFRTVPHGKTAVCNRTLFGRKIKVNRNRWSLLNDELRLFVIAHEVGHCSYDLMHNNKKTTSNQCLSLMSSSAPDNLVCWIDMYSRSWRQYYFDQLFSSSPIMPNPAAVDMDSIILNQNEQAHFKRGFSEWGFLDKENDWISQNQLSIEINYESLMPRQMVYWNGVRLSYNQLTSELRLEKVLDGQETKVYHRFPNYKLTPPVAIKLSKQDELIHYFINGSYFHTINEDQFSKGLTLSTATQQERFNYQVKIKTIANR